MTRFHKGMANSFLVMVILLGLFIPGTVFANGGPLKHPPGGQGLIFFDPDSGIVLSEETVRFTIEKERSDRAYVEVVYYLKNPTPADKDVNLLFVSPMGRTSTTYQSEILRELKNGHNFRVWINGEPASYRWAGPSSLVNWQMVRESGPVVDPVTGRELMDLDYLSSLGVEIPVTMLKDKTTELRITYKRSAGRYADDVVSPVYTYLYFLTPAKFWSGEPRVHLEVALPRGFKIHSNIPLVETAPDVYKTYLDKLPDKEWLFSITDSSLLWYGTNNVAKHNTITITLAVITAFGSLLLSRRLNMKWLAFLAYPAAVVFLFPLRKIAGYPFDPIVVPGFWIIFLLALICTQIVLWWGDREGDSKGISS